MKKKKIDPLDFRADADNMRPLSKWPTKIHDIYEDKKEYLELLRDYQDQLKQYQNLLYAHNRHALLLVFQGMDTAGKDGAIKHVLSGVNPAGFQVFSFKKPSSEELDHGFLWRCTKALPERGRIGIFNRSHYEDVLVVKVHPEILNFNRIPEENIEPMDKFWDNRYKDIRHFETYLTRQGTRVIKFFLHLSKDEQRDRFLERIERSEKNWKLSIADIKERGFWDDYQEAYEKAITETTTKHAPWYVIPADDKKNARLIISQIILHHMEKLDMEFPESEVNEEKLVEIRRMLMEEEKEEKKKKKSKQ